MKHVILGILSAALFAPAAFAQAVVVDGQDDGGVVASASSDPFRLDTREEPFESTGTETLTYSSLWDGTPDSSVTILQSGATEAVAFGLVGESNVVWSVDRDGTYVLTHSTRMGDNPVAEETATFHVSGLTPQVEPELKWKYAKNANGWYCAQVSFTWHAGYDSVLSDMRLLFADRFNAQNQLAAYLVDPATICDPLADTEEYGEETYRVARIDLSAFAELSDGARAVAGVSDATMASSLDRVPRTECTICLRVANRDISSVSPVANVLACLAWKFDDQDVFFPIAESMFAGRQDAEQPPSPSPEPAPPSYSPRPLTAAEANLSAAFGLSPAAVARGTVTCRIASMSFGEDGSVEGTFEVAAEDAGAVVAESGELAEGVKLAVLGAESLDGGFEPLDAAEAGVELLSRKPPYVFRAAKPGKNAFFKVRLESGNTYE